MINKYDFNERMDISYSESRTLGGQLVSSKYVTEQLADISDTSISISGIRDDINRMSAIRGVGNDDLIEEQKRNDMNSKLSFIEKDEAKRHSIEYESTGRIVESVPVTEGSTFGQLTSSDVVGLLTSAALAVTTFTAASMGAPLIATLALGVMTASAIYDTYINWHASEGNYFTRPSGLLRGVVMGVSTLIIPTKPLVGLAGLAGAAFLFTGDKARTYNQLKDYINGNMTKPFMWAIFAAILSVSFLMYRKVRDLSNHRATSVNRLISHREV